MAERGGFEQHVDFWSLQVIDDTLPMMPRLPRLPGRIAPFAPWADDLCRSRVLGRLGVWLVGRANRGKKQESKSSNDATGAGDEREPSPAWPE